MKKLLLAAIFALTSQAFAADCVDLMAGQHTVAGEVCYDVVGTDLEVTYNTTGNWQLGEVHLWVGTDLADMPANKKGNPKIGNFPYKAELLNTDSYTFTIPLASLGLFACPYNFHAAAHAVVSEVYGGVAVRTETGWGAGDQIADKGSWAMYSNVNIDCPGNNGGGTGSSCETAFAFGNSTFIDYNIATRWGWFNYGEADYGVYNVYAGAGQNDISKGTHVGTVSIERGGSIFSPGYQDVRFTVNIFPGFTMEEAHFYASEQFPTTAAPGQYGNTFDFTSPGVTYFQTPWIDLNSGGYYYTIFHGVVCGEY